MFKGLVSPYDETGIFYDKKSRPDLFGSNFFLILGVGCSYFTGISSGGIAIDLAPLFLNPNILGPLSPYPPAPHLKNNSIQRQISDQYRTGYSDKPVISTGKYQTVLPSQIIFITNAWLRVHVAQWIWCRINIVWVFHYFVIFWNWLGVLMPKCQKSLGSQRDTSPLTM